MGYTYVMSDIHGMSHLLEEMLEKIRFSAEDRLYILGDMIDRGPDPGGVMDLAAAHPNITALRGNHEDTFAEWYLTVTEAERSGYFYNTYAVLSEDPERKERIPEYVNWMKRLPLYKKVKQDGTCYLLAHASTEGVLQMWKRKDGFLWDSSFIEKERGVPGYISVVGHVPTFILRGYPKEPATIWRSPTGGSSMWTAALPSGCTADDSGVSALRQERSSIRRRSRNRGCLRRTGLCESGCGTGGRETG